MLLLVLAIFVRIVVTHDFHDGFEKRPEHVFEFNKMHSGFGEASRQFAEFESINNRVFQETRQRMRDHLPRHWGMDVEHNAIFKGEISCHVMIGSDALDDFRNIRDYGVYKITDIEVIDEETGEYYPIIRQGDDFIAYNPDLDNVHERRIIRVNIKHRGCVPLNSGCTAVTTHISSYKKHHVHALGFTRLNMAVKYFTEECSLIRRIFNFWPFN